MADRYTGRHIRQARHGAWVTKKRSRARSNRTMLPAAAALTVAGILIGGSGAVVQLSSGGDAGTSAELATGFDPADYPPPDREALADRASRDNTRTPAPDATSTSPSNNGLVTMRGSCEASYYSEPQDTASGETFDPQELTAAHKSLPFDSQVRVTNVDNGKSVVVRINDRGPFVDGRCLDLSQAAFETISSIGAGVADVRFEVLIEDAT